MVEVEVEAVVEPVELVVVVVAVEMVEVEAVTQSQVLLFVQTQDWMVTKEPEPEMLSVSTSYNSFQSLLIHISQSKNQCHNQTFHLNSIILRH